MLLVLSKTLPALLFPAGLVIFLCLLASWLAFRRGAAAAGIVALLAAMVLYTAACPVVSHRLLLGLERQHPPPDDYPQADAIVLLGGGMAPLTPPRIHPETNWAGDRVLHAARLWRRGAAPVLVTTGGHIPFIRDVSISEAEAYAMLLDELLGVPREAVMLVPGSRNTHEDAVMTRAMFDSAGMHLEILLVTSATHMPRAAALFRRQGFIVHPAPTDYRADESREFRAFNLLPSGTAMALTYVALNEYVGMAVYRLLGRL